MNHTRNRTPSIQQQQQKPVRFLTDVTDFSHMNANAYYNHDQRQATQSHQAPYEILAAAREICSTLERTYAEMWMKSENDIVAAHKNEHIDIPAVTWW